MPGPAVQGGQFALRIAHELGVEIGHERERVGKLLRLEAGRYTEAARVEWGTVVALLGGKLSITVG